MTGPPEKLYPITMRFAYLVQSEGALPPAFATAAGGDPTCLFHLTFKRQEANAIFLPGSTWTEGRNRLLQAARASGRPFDYYIFCDDDVAFERGSWLEFEQELQSLQPAIGLPAYPHPHSHEGAHAVYDFDAIVNAFHSDIIEDAVLLPYIADYDNISWWLSQYFVIHLAGALYPNGVVKFPSISIDNPQHREYPRIDAKDFSNYDEAYFALWKDDDQARRCFRSHFATRDDPPHIPVVFDSYRLPLNIRKKLAARLADIGRQV